MNPKIALAASAAAAVAATLTAPLAARADTPPLPPPPPANLPAMTQLHLAKPTSSIAHAGRLVTITAAATDDKGAAVNGAQVACSAHVGARTAQVVKASLANGKASCLLRVPRGTAGKRLTGSLSISIPGSSAASPFVLRIAA